MYAHARQVGALIPLPLACVYESHMKNKKREPQCLVVGLDMRSSVLEALLDAEILVYLSTCVADFLNDICLRNTQHNK